MSEHQYTSSDRSFYAYDKNFLNIGYAMDVALEEYFASVLFNGEGHRIVYASNAYALRRRTEVERRRTGQPRVALNLPMMNYKLRDFDMDTDKGWWNARGYTKGVFIDEIGASVQISPIDLAYEATYWCHREEELRYAYTKLRREADINTDITGYIQVKDHVLPVHGELDYTGLAYDPEYSEQEWLERNKIHTASMDFNVTTFLMVLDTAVTIPLKVLFTFNSLHGDPATEVTEETVNLLIDHFSETVTNASELTS